jgi:hypothetical protein
MKKNFSLLILLGVFCISSSSYAATTDVWLDEVISWYDVDPLSGGVPTNVLGPIGGGGLNISDGDEFVAAFTNNIALDGPGNDLYLYENIDTSDETVNVWVSPDNIGFTFLGMASNDEAFDFGAVGVDNIRYIKLIGNSLGGSSPGYDLLAVEALNSAVPIPGAIWLLGSGLIGFVGLRRKFRKP